MEKYSINSNIAEMDSCYRRCKKLIARSDKGESIPWLVAFGRLLTDKPINASFFFSGLEDELERLSITSRADEQDSERLSVRSGSWPDGAGNDERNTQDPVRN